MGLSFRDVLHMVTLTLAEIIGVDKRKESIGKNKDADILIMEKQANVLKTIVRGKLLNSGTSELKANET